MVHLGTTAYNLHMLWRTPLLLLSPLDLAAFSRTYVDVVLGLMDVVLDGLVSVRLHVSNICTPPLAFGGCISSCGTAASYCEHLLCTLHPQIQHVQSCTQHDHISSREHAWLNCASLRPKNNCHPRVMSHLPLFASSPTFSLTSQTPTTLLEHDERLGPDERPHCDDLRQSGGFTLTVTLTGYEPQIIETNVIDSETISPQDLEPRRIELDRNLGTDPYQIQESEK